METTARVDARLDLVRAAKLLKVSADQLFAKDKELDIANIFKFLSAIGLRGEIEPGARIEDPALAKLLREKPDLDAFLNPVEKFLEYPKNSLGYAYAKYMQSERLDAGVLADASMSYDQEQFVVPEMKYLFDRIRQLHDVWHALTGYGSDLAGEFGILMFSLAQIPVAPLAFLMGSVFLGAPLVIPRERLSVQPYMLAAWRRGKRAKPLLAADWERLMALPLADVQRELRIVPSNVAHPRGIFYWDPKRRLVRRPAGNDMQYLAMN